MKRNQRRRSLFAGLALALATAGGWLVAERIEAPAVSPASGAAEERVIARQADDPDRRVLRSTLERARAASLDTLPLSDVVARVGRTFLGTPYTPNTLDPPGPERLVVNLRELDCVTFVENALVLGRMVRAGVTDFDAYRSELRRVRYRDGVIDGYASRLHYFSEWIADNEAKGIVRDVTRELDGVRDAEPIDFMSENADAYRQLGDPVTSAAIRGIEARLSERPRYFIPQDRIADIEDRIWTGDIIAATSSLEGLDVAHTGIAVRVDGRVHLMHAPLVGSSVEISELPLAERIRGIEGQDGIMVARPV